MKQILKDFIELFEIGPNLTRIGLIQFSAESVEEFPMERFASKESLVKAVDNVEYQGGRFTHLGGALKRAKESLEKSRKESLTTTAAAPTTEATTADVMTAAATVADVTTADVATAAATAAAATTADIMTAAATTADAATAAATTAVAEPLTLET